MQEGHVICSPAYPQEASSLSPHTPSHSAAEETHHRKKEENVKMKGFFWGGRHLIGCIFKHVYSCLHIPCPLDGNIPLTMHSVLKLHLEPK